MPVGEALGVTTGAGPEEQAVRHALDRGVLSNRPEYTDDMAAVGDPGAETDRLVSLGASRLAAYEDGGVALADPDGNEFCLYRTFDHSER